MRQVTKYSAEIKSQVIQKALAANAPGVVELSREFNIPISTIHTWISNMKKNVTRHAKPNEAKRPGDRSALEKFQAIIDTADKDESEIAKYCREQGFYSSHLEQWRKQMLDSLSISANNSAEKIELNKSKLALKQLQQELNRKEKALAEVSALLVLKKKVDLLWGASEDA